ncbi:unnamed protein product [Mytilus edulis]|uniref:Uncharacterized protein n=1 Tax=Mytilus edulis TaxID=6550 RepID=A0A8S3UVL0_MYTED|nr:unnamed protein product [Mytilus edulis]
MAAVNPYGQGPPPQYNGGPGNPGPGIAPPPFGHGGPGTAPPPFGYDGQQNGPGAAPYPLGYGPEFAPPPSGYGGYPQPQQQYGVTKQLSDKKAKIDMPIKDKNNNMLTTERDQYLRWKEHFQEDLNRKEPDNLEKFPEAPLDLEIDTDPPSKQEIQAAIKSLKKQKVTWHRPTKCRTF